MSLTDQTIFSSPVEVLVNEVEGLKLALTREREIKRHYESENSRLLEIIRDFKRQRFGPRSERWESQEQLVFNEAETLAKMARPESDDDEDRVEVKAHTKARGKRKPLPENLPREVVTLELSENERMGSDGKPMRPIGKEISEKLHYEPAVMKVIEYHRIRYGEDSGDTGVIAPPVPSIIPKANVTPGLLAHIVMQKYGYGKPLYRQEDEFKRMGVEIPRCTQARWVVTSAGECRPLWNILEERVMSSFYVSCDETWTQVIDEKGRPGESKSWMWVRCTPGDEKKIVLFDYDPHRTNEVAKRLFADYRGALQVDGYGAYDILEKQEGLIRLGCNMHGRRKFESAHKIGAKEGKSLAEEALRYYKILYDIEEEARDLSPPDRHRLRQEKAVPIWAEFKEWSDRTHSKVPPKSKIGQAFHYFPRRPLQIPPVVARSKSPSKLSGTW